VNKVILMGRLTRDPDVRYTNDADPLAIARFTLAVNRRTRKEGEQSADFISCVAFGKAAEHAEKYYRKGLQIAISGRIQTGSYTNREGKKVHTVDIVIEEQEFADSKNSGAAGQASGSSGDYETDKDGFMHIPDGVEDEGLPFS